MPPKIDLEPYRSAVARWIHEGWRYDDILAELHSDGVPLSRNTLVRQIRLWNLTQQPKLQDTPELRRRVEELFAVNGLRDKETVEILQREGFQIRQRGLQRLRFRMGLLRRSARGAFVVRHDNLKSSREHQGAEPTDQDSPTNGQVQVQD